MELYELISGKYLDEFYRGSVKMKSWVVWEAEPCLPKDAITN